MLKHQVFCFNPFQENTYIIYTETGACTIIDPGCQTFDEQQTLFDFIQSHQLIPKAVWLTHAHIDHVLGLEFCTRKFGIKAWLTPAEVSQLKAVEVYAPNYGVFNFQTTEELEILIPNAKLKVDKEEFTVLNVPGHSPGHVAFYHGASGQIWGGDVLFRQSIGRTDLPGGNFQQLEFSIRNQLYTLPPETTVYPGHGPETTIGFEMQFNHYVKA